MNVRIAMILSLISSLVACARAPVLPTERPGQSSAPVVEREMTLELIREHLWRKKWNVAFSPSTLIEHETVSEILAALLDGARDGKAELAVLSAKAKAIDFRLEVWRVSGLVFWTLMEQDEHRHGAGAYVIRVGQKPLAGPEIVLQAPHAYFDLGTGDIAAALFFHPDVNIRALYTNTVHRYWDANEGTRKRDESPSDVCHRVDHVFQQATDTAAKILGTLAVVQLHGFQDKKSRPDVVVSAGRTDGGSPVIEALTAGFKEFLGDVKRFPDDYDQLGGTQNAQGRLLNALPRAQFVHIEMGANVRKKLRTKPRLMARFADVLFGEALQTASQKDLK